MAETPLLIVADDLTGAADSAARCHAAGLPSRIWLTPPSPPLPAGVVAFSTDSRYLSPSAAAARVRARCLPMLASRATWYKKIDSTLRGNIGAELDALLDVLAACPNPPPCAIVCPAFPAQGRGLAGGVLQFGERSAQPVHLPTLLRQQSSRPVAAIGLDTVREGVEAISNAVMVALARGAALIVVDALSEDDLDQLWAAVQQGAPDALLCGSAGLMAPLARAMAQQEGAPQLKRQTPLLRPPLLVVVGSGSAMAHRQIDAMRQESGVAVVELDTDQGQGLARLPGDMRVVVLHLPQPSPGTPLEGDHARALAATLAETAVRLAAQLRPGILLLVGGDTTVHTLERMGIRRLTVLAELMPGIPLLEGVDGNGRRLSLITKAGNFGDEQTLQAIYARLV